MDTNSSYHGGKRGGRRVPAAIVVRAAVFAGLLCGFVLGGAETAAAQADALKQGISAYKEKRNQDAVRFLNQAIRNNPSDANAYYFLGLTHHRLKSHSRTIQALTKALSLKPDLADAHFFLGLAYYKLEDFAKAKAQFQTLRRMKPGSELAASGDKYLEIMARPKKEKRDWDLQLEAGVTYSDNVSRVELDQITRSSDYAGTFDASGTYRFLDEKNIKASVGYDFSQLLYFDVTDQDFQSHTVRGSVGRPFRNWEPSIGLSYNVNILDGSGFLTITTVSPKIAYFPKAWLYTELAYNYLDKDFDRFPTRDATANQFGLTQFFFFAKSKGYFMAAVQYQKEDANGAEFDYEAGKASAALRVPLGWLGGAKGARSKNFFVPQNFRAKISGSIRFRDYENVTPSIGKKRFDATKKARLSLKTNFTDKLIGTVQADYINSDSNLSSVDYVERNYSLFLTYNF